MSDGELLIIYTLWTILLGHRQIDRTSKNLGSVGFIVLASFLIGRRLLT